MRAYLGLQQKKNEKNKILRGDSNGHVDVDLFTDGKGLVIGNSQALVYYSLGNPSLARGVQWIGKAFYANPPWTPYMLLCFFRKQNDDIEFSPEDTSCICIVSVDPTAALCPRRASGSVCNDIPPAPSASIPDLSQGFSSLRPMRTSVTRAGPTVLA